MTSKRRIFQKYTRTSKTTKQARKVSVQRFWVVRNDQKHQKCINRMYGNFGCEGKSFLLFFKRCITKRKEARKFFNLKGFQYHENKQKKLWQGATAWFTVAWAAQQSVLSPTNRVVALQTCILATPRLVMSWQFSGWWHTNVNMNLNTGTYLDTAVNTRTWT